MGLHVTSPSEARGFQDLVERYLGVLSEPKFPWIENHRRLRRLGSGGQGVVFLCERCGADDFRLFVALKFFSPERFPDAWEYDQAMARMARVAVRVAQIQQDTLIDVHNFVELERIRVMEMEWVDGYDLHRLLTPAMHQRLRIKVSSERWKYLNDVIITDGLAQPRLKPGVAIAVLRDALAALSALHGEGIVHGDVKPSNVMLKRTGNAKLVDVGSAYEWQAPPDLRTCTPEYAAPEILQGKVGTPRSDLASLGYVLVEMLSGVSPFAGLRADRGALLEAKQTILQRLSGILPEEVVRNELLMYFISGLVAPDADDRFASAEDADLVEQGAANFHRQLVKVDLASEYDNEIRAWLAELD